MPTTTPDPAYSADDLFSFADALATALWNQYNASSDPTERRILGDLYDSAADIRNALEDDIDPT